MFADVRASSVVVRRSGPTGVTNEMKRIKLANQP